MIILGLDISSHSTGWSVINGKEKKLIDYGLISVVGSMGVTQRLYFFGNEIKKIIDKYQPDEIAIEETILVRGPKIMRTLARFSGVALFQAFSYQKREIATFEPTMWKKSLGLKGSAKKPEIQLKICEIFNLIEKEKIEEYSKIIDEYIRKDKDYKKPSNFTLLENTNKKLDKELKKLKTELKRKQKHSEKRRGLSNEEIVERIKESEVFETLVDTKEAELKEKKDSLKRSKKEHNKEVKETNKGFEKVSIDIYSDCGVNPDIADSIGVALALNETYKRV